MKKKINWKQIISTAVSVLLALSIMAFLFLASDSAELEEVQQQEMQKLTLQVTPAEDAFVPVAENSRYLLEANLKKAWIRLRDQKTGALWQSCPAEIAGAEKITGSQNLSLASMISIRYANRDNNTTTQTAMAGSVLKNTMNATRIENGVRFDFLFGNEGFLVPVQITLTENGMKAEILTREIQEAGGGMLLTSVVLLPGFGAAKENEPGFFFLPDGSGMTVPFERRLADYSARIYGTDPAVVQTTKTEEEPRVALPVFGISAKGQSILAVITDGDSRAQLRTVSPTGKSPYASVSSELIYRESILVEVSQKTFESTQVNMFEPAHTAIAAYSVEYRPCAADGIVAMANTYRNYLLTDGGLHPQEQVTPALQSELLGGVTRVESFLGIPMEQTVAVTDFAAADKLMQALSSSGCGAVPTLYTNWATGGSKKRLTVELTAENALGGAKGLQALAEHQKKLGNPLYLELNLTELQQSQSGYSAQYDAAQSVRKEPAVQYTYLMSTFQIDKSKAMTYLLAPAGIERAAKQAAEKLNSYPVSGYAPSTLGNQIYSDFGHDNLDRGAGKTIFQSALEGLQSSGGALLLKAPNAYALPYAGIIQDAYVTSDGALAGGRSVPFYTMALHGLVPMSTPAMNRETAKGRTFLQALSCGIGMKVMLGAGQIEKLAGTQLAAESGIEAEAWTEQAEKEARELRVYLEKISDQPVRSYTVLQAGVYETVFENGIGVIVNENDREVVVNGTKIAAGGYAAIGW